MSNVGEPVPVEVALVQPMAVEVEVVVVITLFGSNFLHWGPRKRSLLDRVGPAQPLMTRMARTGEIRRLVLI